MHPKYADLLDPVYFEYAKMVEESDKLVANQPVAVRRETYQKSTLPIQTDNGIETTDSNIAARDGYSIPVRFFFNKTSKSSGALTVYLHGGGWVLGNLDTHHDICCDICNNTSTNVLAVDYRLAPENPFPIPLMDCIDAIKATLELTLELPKYHSIVLAGDSAGANLSAASILSGEFELEKIIGQVLIYAGLGASIEEKSFVEHVDGPILSTSSLEYFFLSYLGNDESKISELTSPLIAKDLSSMPETYISAAENDPLRDDSLLFHEKLIRQGVKSRLQIEEKLGHGYLRVRNQSTSAISAFTAICNSIVDMHAGGSNN